MSNADDGDILVSLLRVKVSICAYNDIRGIAWDSDSIRPFHQN